MTALLARLAALPLAMLRQARVRLRWLRVAWSFCQWRLVLEMVLTTPVRAVRFTRAYLRGEPC